MKKIGLLLLMILFSHATGVIAQNANKNSDNGHAFLKACKNGDTTEVMRLIKLGENVNLQDVNGRTPLHESAKYGRIECTKLLIQKGANIETKNNKGNSPLHECAIGTKDRMFWDGSKNGGSVIITREEGCTQVAMLLVSKGASVNCKNMEGKTPLKIAIENEYKNLADYLRSVGGKE